MGAKAEGVHTKDPVGRALVQPLSGLPGRRPERNEERQEVVRAFKRGEVRVLIATDVASRGLDIPAIKTVVS